MYERRHIAVGQLDQHYGARVPPSIGHFNGMCIGGRKGFFT